MTITRPIPEEALPVVEIIRRDVPRPETLPVAQTNSCMRWYRGALLCCPMGLHGTAKLGAPSDGFHFEGELRNCTSDAIEQLGIWWDEQTDARAAVDAVWGEA